MINMLKHYSVILLFCILCPSIDSAPPEKPYEKGMAENEEGILNLAKRSYQHIFQDDYTDDDDYYYYVDDDDSHNIKPRSRPDDDSGDFGSGNYMGVGLVSEKVPAPQQFGSGGVINYLENEFPDLVHEKDNKVEKTKLSGQSDVEDLAERLSDNSTSTYKTDDPSITTTTIEKTTLPSPSSSTTLSTIQPSTLSTTLTQVSFSSSHSSTTPGSITKTTTTSLVTNNQKCESKDCGLWNLQIEPEFQSHLPGVNISIRCVITDVNEANGTDKMHFQFLWYLQSVDETGNFIGNSDVLFVKEAQLEDSGTRICVVSDLDGCCVKSASGEVVVYDKPAYLTHILVIAGVVVGLLLLVCIPMTLHLRRKHRNWKKNDGTETDDTQALT